MDVLTAMFMHGGWMHLIGNMWFLWIYGDNVEESSDTGNTLHFTFSADWLRDCLTWRWRLIRGYHIRRERSHRRRNGSISD